MKDNIKSLFKGYYIQFRKKTSTAIISVGYINAPDNYMQYSDYKLAEIEKIKDYIAQGHEFRSEMSKAARLLDDDMMYEI